MNKTDIAKSIAELKELMGQRFGFEMELYLFGSVARNDYGPESDIDVLVLLPGEVDTLLKTEVIDLAYGIGLKNNVVFNMITRSKKIWESDMAAVTPFHENLTREALRI
jgi:predicted nucleotidyltransferase